MPKSSVRRNWKRKVKKKKEGEKRKSIFIFHLPRRGRKKGEGLSCFLAEGERTREENKKKKRKGATLKFSH